MGVLIVFFSRSYRFGLVLLVVMVMSTALVTHAKEGDPVRLSEALDGIRLGGHVHSIATGLRQEFRDGTRDDTSALDVNSVELGLTASPVQAVDANVTVLLEEELDGGTPGDGFAVDQAYVVLAGNHRPLVERNGRDRFEVNPWYLKAGKFYVPFGTRMDYHTFDVISEPQTLALAETLESQVTLGYTPFEGLDAYVGAFSGDGADSEGGSARDNELDDVYAGVDLNRDPVSLSLQWTNNLNNSIALVEETGAQARAVGGLSVYGSLSRGAATLQLAHVRALDAYEDTLGASGNDPTSTSVEVTYNSLLQLYDQAFTGTLVYERTDEWVRHPETVHGLVVDAPLFEGTTASLQYLERTYDASSRLEDERLLSARLAVGFQELLGGAGAGE